MAFHAARSGETRMDHETWLIYFKMPAPVRKWIDANGGYEKLPVQGFWTMYDRDLWRWDIPGAKPNEFLRL
jgi:hypothetical protein